MIDKKVFGFLVVITVLGTILRVYQIGFQCFWTEEQFVIDLVKLPFIDIAVRSISSDFNPPLFYFAAKFSWLLFGMNDVAIRYPSLVCGIALIPVMFVLGRAYKNDISGLYCAGITSILYPLVCYSQYGRSYSMTVLFFALTLIFYIRIKKEVDNNHTLFWVLSAVTVWCHLFAMIPIGLMIIDLFISKKIKGVFTFVVLGAPLLVSLLSVIRDRTSGKGFTYGNTLPQLIFGTPLEFFGLLYPVFIVMAFIGWMVDTSKIKNSLLAIVVITIIVGIAASLFTPFFPRYYLTVAIICILFISVALTEVTCLLDKRIHIPLLFALIAVMLLFQASDFVILYTVQRYVC